MVELDLGIKSFTEKNEILRTGSVRSQIQFPEVNEDLSGLSKDGEAASLMLAEVDEDPNTNPHYVDPPPRNINEPEVVMDLTDFYDVQLFTTVYVGSNNQSF